jgi:choline-glycine betaine transporter
LKRIKKISTYVFGNSFQVAIIVYSGIAQFGAVLLGIEAGNFEVTDKGYIVLTIVLFLISFFLSLTGYYINQITQNKTVEVVEKTVETIGKTAPKTKYKDIITKVDDISGHKHSIQTKKTKK